MEKMNEWSAVFSDGLDMWQESMNGSRVVFCDSLDIRRVNEDNFLKRVRNAELMDVVSMETFGERDPYSEWVLERESQQGRDQMGQKGAGQSHAMEVMNKVEAVQPVHTRDIKKGILSQPKPHVKFLTP